MRQELLKKGATSQQCTNYMFHIGIFMRTDLWRWVIFIWVDTLYYALRETSDAK